MLSTADFYEAFDAAGFLKPASWTPSTGGAQQTGSVRFRSPDVELFAGGQVSREYSISYQASLFPGLKTGETVIVDGVTYKVRRSPEAELDGSRLICRLEKP